MDALFPHLFGHSEISFHVTFTPYTSLSEAKAKMEKERIKAPEGVAHASGVVTKTSAWRHESLPQLRLSVFIENNCGLFINISWKFLFYVDQSQCDSGRAPEGDS